MIKVNELRVGNLVGLNNRVVTVESLTGGFNYFGAEEHDRGHLIGLYHVLFEKGEGVPLTLDWLKKLGFEDVYDNGYDCALRLERFTFAISLDRRMLLIADPKAANQRAKGIGGIPMEYVHQLQNLVFALTGEELTIKETV